MKLNHRPLILTSLHFVISVKNKIKNKIFKIFGYLRYSLFDIYLKTTGIVAIRLGGMTSIYNGFISICLSLQCCWRTFLLLCTKPAFVTSSFLLLTLFFTDCEQGSYASHTFNVFIPILRHPLVLAFGPSV